MNKLLDFRGHQLLDKHIMIYRTISGASPLVHPLLTSHNLVRCRLSIHLVSHLRLPASSKWWTETQPTFWTPMVQVKTLQICKHQNIKKSSQICLSSVASREVAIRIPSGPHHRQQLRLNRSPWDDLSASQMATANLGGKTVNKRFLCYQVPARAKLLVKHLSPKEVRELDFRTACAQIYIQI